MIRLIIILIIVYSMTSCMSGRVTYLTPIKEVVWTSQEYIYYWVDKEKTKLGRIKNTDNYMCAVGDILELKEIYRK